MSEDAVKYHLAYQEQKIEDLKSEIHFDLEALQKLVGYCISTGGFDSRLYNNALAIKEKDTKLRALEETQARLKAAVEAKPKETP